MTDAPQTRPGNRILFVSMYPLRDVRSGPEVRIVNLLAALRERVEVDLVSGARSERRSAWLRYFRTHRLRRVSGVYVESSSALPDPVDIAGLAAAKRRGIRVLTYVRDAYQLFRDEYPAANAWRGLVGRAFPLAVSALRRSSSALAFPTRGLAEAVLGERAGEAVVLPPGSPSPVEVPRDPSARSLLYVGDLRLAAQGGATLIEAVDRVRRRGADLDLVCVVRPGGEPPNPPPSWVRIERAGSDEIPRLLGGVLATVIPRAPGRYNDLALPIKLMDSLAYGRPLVVTDRRETARLVRSAGAGIVVGDGPEAMADGLGALATAPDEQLSTWSEAAHRAARAHAWPARADEILRFLSGS